MLSYRVQAREHLGVVNRAFGGRVVHHSSWKTLAKFDQEALAIEYVTPRCRFGLRQWRVVQGSRIVREWK